MSTRRSMRRTRSAGLLAAAGVLAALAFSLSPLTGHAGTAVTFGATYVDSTLAGGEPFVIYSHAGNGGSGDLIYAAHEGTTHIDKNGVSNPDSACDVLPPKTTIGPPNFPTGYVCSYDNHINQWYSTDGGATWTLDSNAANPLSGNDVIGSGVTDTGFSDPSLTEDAPPTTGSAPQDIYDTGIDLANDALYASNDGGVTWEGTPDCVEGDRPWLAGGQNGEVFLATDLEGPQPGGNSSLISGHAYFHGLVEEVGGTIASISCNPYGIADPAGGDAQDYFDRNGDACTLYASTYTGTNCTGTDTGDIIEGDSGFSDGGFGIGVLPNASQAWGAGQTFANNSGTPTGVFIDSEGTDCTNHTVAEPSGTDPNLCSELGPIDPEIAIDSANNTYVVWATNPRTTDPNDTNGCTGATTAGSGSAILPNSIYMMYTPDEGKTWKGPFTIADPTTSNNTTLLWPFITAGANGNVAIVWYQSNQLTDPDCDSANASGGPGLPPTKWTLQETSIYGVTSATYPPASVNTFPTEVCCNTLNQPVAHPGGVFHGIDGAGGGICQSGTTCVATGQDRRLGDYFTDALDQNGCVLIATGDTDMVDATTGGALNLSRPVVLEQASGPSLTTGQPCTSVLASGPGSTTPEVPSVPVLAAVGAAMIGAGVTLRRRRRRGSDAAL